MNTLPVLDDNTSDGMVIGYAASEREAIDNARYWTRQHDEDRRPVAASIETVRLARKQIEA